MVTVREKTTVTQRVHGACPTHSRTEISVRDVKAVVDEPKEREGTNIRGDEMRALRKLRRGYPRD